MENRKVGYLVLGISLIIAIIVLLFNQTLNELAGGCSMVQQGLSCPAHDAIPLQTYLSLSVVGILVIIGIFLVFNKPKDRIIIRKISDKKDKKNIDVSELKTEEKEVFKLVQENKAVFQADLIDKTKYGKAKVTRILDRLEGRGLVERKRRGMTNVVVLRTI